MYILLQGLEHNTLYFFNFEDLTVFLFFYYILSSLPLSANLMYLLLLFSLTSFCCYDLEIRSWISLSHISLEISSSPMTLNTICVLITFMIILNICSQILWQSFLRKTELNFTSLNMECALYIVTLFLNFVFIIVDLQCYINFCCTAKWPSHISIYMLFFTLSSIVFHHKWWDISFSLLIHFIY